MYSFLVLLWALFVGGAILMSYQTKIQEIGITADREIDKCRQDYLMNRYLNSNEGVILQSKQSSNSADRNRPACKKSQTN